MKIELESTQKVIAVGDKLVRVYEGFTDSGVGVYCLLMPFADEDAKQAIKVLNTTKEPSMTRLSITTN